MLIALAVILVLLLSLFIGFFIYTFGRYHFHDYTAGDPMPETDGWYPYRETLQAGADWIRSAAAEPLEMQSFDGLTLRARYLAVPESRRLLILCHGYHGFPHTDFSPFARFYHEQGFNLLLIDERAQNRSEGRLITFGVHESRDLADWIRFINERYPGQEILLHGVSMGATTVLSVPRFDLPENVRGIIADCGFSSPYEIIKHVMVQRFPFLPEGFLHVQDLLCALFGHFRMKDIDTAEILAASRLPLLLIHGQDDDFVPPEMSVRAFEAANEPKQLLLVPGATHAASGFAAPELYRETLLQFMRTTNFL